MCVCVCVCACAYVRAYVRACVCVRACAYIYSYTFRSYPQLVCTYLVSFKCLRLSFFVRGVLYRASLYLSHFPSISPLSISIYLSHPCPTIPLFVYPRSVALSVSVALFLSSSTPFSLDLILYECIYHSIWISFSLSLSLSLSFCKTFLYFLHSFKLLVTSEVCLVCKIQFQNQS